MTISSLSLFSQNVTPSQEFIKIPVPVVRKIVVDLVKGDSAMAQLNQSKLMIEELDNKTKVQDSIIVNYRQVDGNNQKIISNLERKVEIIEGEHPGSSYYAAELRQDVDYANQVARGMGLEFGFRSS